MRVVSSHEVQSHQAQPHEPQTRRSGKRGILLCCAASWALALPGIAQAQQAQQAQGGLGDIVVTAQKRTESAQGVPLSIQSLGAQKLEALGAAKLQNIEMAAPSVSFGDGSEQGRAGIRGVIDYSRNAGYDSRVGIYVDGVYYSRSWMNNLTLLGVQQVDVLRGPQGTLFGKNTDAGAIAITTLQPGRRTEGEVQAEVGNFGYWKLGGRLAAPVGSDLAMQLAATHVESRGYYHNSYTSQRNQGLHGDAVAGKLRYQPGAGIDITLAGDYTRDRNTTQHYTAPPAAGGDPYTFRSYYNDHANRDMGGLSLSARVPLGGGYDLTALLNQHTRQFSQEARIASPRRRTYDFVAGVYYFWANNQDDYTSLWGSGLAQLGSVYGLYAGASTGAHASVSTQSVAGFVQGSWRPGRVIELFAGGRLTYEQKRLNDLTTHDPYGYFLAGLHGYADSLSNSFFTPRGGVNLHLTPHVLVFGTVSRGFKSGGWNVEGTSLAAQAAGIRFRPEKVTSYEIGLKSDFLDRRARFNLTGFYERFTDFQVFTFVPTTLYGVTSLTSSLTNAGAVSSQGGEVELAVIPVRGLTVSANYTYDVSRFDRYPGGGGTVAGVPLDAHGVQTPYAPRHKLYAALDYAGQLSPAVGITAHFGYSAQSSENFDPKVINPAYGRYYFIQGYDLADARLGLAGTHSRWSAALWSKNLFDRRYVLFANRTALLQAPAVMYGEPRSFGLTVGYRF